MTKRGRPKGATSRVEIHPQSTLLTVPQFRALFSISDSKARDMIANGEVQSLKLGARRMVLRASAEKLIADALATEGVVQTEQDRERAGGRR